jgi:CubicO group peptidase (beta-lactamase class C family)
VIPQFGRVWREKDDGEWSRAAFPLMLVNDTENHAHQGLATFLYRGAEVSALQLQFVQQNAPYLLSPYCQFWGAARATFTNTEVQNSAAQREAAKQELAARLPAQPLAALRKTLPAGTLDGLGGPVLPQWQVALGLVHEGTLYYEGGDTPQGAYPYPLEMRFGVRSVTKSVGAPLSLLRLAQVYGPYVLELKIGDYVPGLDPKWNRIRFIDAANMASGFGGVGSFVTHPNDDNEGYLLADYDGWYTAPSHAQKLAHINTHLKPYPWEPGTVMRYRDQDFYLLGAAVDAFLKSVRGPQADVWHMLEEEVFTPIGIAHAPMVRTREPDGREGLAWFNAGYYPTLDDLAKIALLMADKGEHNGVQILHRGLTEDLLAARGALDKDGDAARPADRAAGAPPPRLYRMGYHYTAWTGTRSGQLLQLPTMSGFGDNEVIIFPGRTIAIRAAKAVTWKGGPVVHSDDPLATARAVDRLAPL